jgi:hypothetical protein
MKIEEIALDVASSINPKNWYDNEYTVEFAKALLSRVDEERTKAGWKPMPIALTEEMSAVIRNEHTVYSTEDELYAAMLSAAPEMPK